MRILWLKTELLHPIDCGGRIRTYFLARELVRQHHITYLTLDDGRSAPDAKERAHEYCHELVCIPHQPLAQPPPGFFSQVAQHLRSPVPHFMNKYRSEEMSRGILERDKRREFDVLVSDFLMPSINVPPGLSAATVLFDRNVEANVVKRYCSIQKNPFKRAYLHGLWQKTMAFEQETCRRFDQVITVSAADRDTIRLDYGVESVQDSPTGVDTEFFRPSGNEKPLRHNLVFTGMMNWLPNEDAVCYFVQEILPLVREAVPGVTLTVVGRDPYPRLLELSKRDPAITVTGRVEDVRPYLERASCFIVPLRVGSGVRLKIFEAMAMEKPVVSTSIGAEGLPLRNGIDVLLADTPADFAASVVRLLIDEEYARTFGARAADRVRAQFTWARAAEAFAEICQNTIARKTPLPVPTQLPPALQKNASNYF